LHHARHHQRIAFSEQLARPSQFELNAPAAGQHAEAATQPAQYDGKVQGAQDGLLLRRVQPGQVGDAVEQRAHASHIALKHGEQRLAAFAAARPLQPRRDRGNHAEQPAQVVDCLSPERGRCFVEGLRRPAWRFAQVCLQGMGHKRSGGSERGAEKGLGGVHDAR
jgi:hypothetical protein